uniref:Putative secreted protein n=1 Tax=Panstrongylus lignarius TaxID=156445 RepID=A0A224XZ03_9HEMI
MEILILDVILNVSLIQTVVTTKPALITNASILVPVRAASMLFVLVSIIYQSAIAQINTPVTLLSLVIQSIQHCHQVWVIQETRVILRHVVLTVVALYRIKVLLYAHAYQVIRVCLLFASLNVSLVQNVYLTKHVLIKSVLTRVLDYAVLEQNA